MILQFVTIKRIQSNDYYNTFIQSNNYGLKHFLYQ